MSADYPVIRLARPDHFAELSKDQREGEIKQWCDEALAPVLATLDKGMNHAFGEDFGRVSDLTDIVPIAMARSTKRIVPFVVELRNIPFEQQRQILFYVVDRLPRFIGGALDATGNGAYLAEVAMQRYGSMRIAQVKLNSTFYLENFPPLKAAYEDGMIVGPRDAELLDDLALVKMIGGIPQIPPVRTIAAAGKTASSSSARRITRHGDYAVAQMLAYFATRANFAEYGYVPAAAGDPLDPDEQRFNEWAGRRAEEPDILFGDHKGRLW
jgi:phage FluMu gp28-like protein